MTELEDRDTPQNLYNAVISACEQASRWREVGSSIRFDAWKEPKLHSSLTMNRW